MEKFINEFKGKSRHHKKFVDFLYPELKIVKDAITFLAEQFISNGSIEKKDIISSINKFMIE